MNFSINFNKIWKFCIDSRIFVRFVFSRRKVQATHDTTRTQRRQGVKSEESNRWKLFIKRPSRIPLRGGGGGGKRDNFVHSKAPVVVLLRPDAQDMQYMLIVCGASRAAPNTNGQTICHHLGANRPSLLSLPSSTVLPPTWHVWTELLSNGRHYYLLDIIWSEKFEY